MSVPVVKFICLTIMAIMGLFVVRSISDSHEKLITVKNILLMSCLVVLPAVIYDIHYTYIYTITIYFITIITYQQVLNISMIKSTISSGILIVSLFLLDFTTSLVLAPFFSIEQARNLWYVSIISNIAFSTILIMFFNIENVKKVLNSFVEKIENKRQTKFILFFILIIIAMSTLLYTLGNNFKLDAIFTTNYLLFIIFFLLVIFLVNEKNNYEKLSDDYDNLFEYVKVFEEWVEKEQFVRHEYKNQLAIIREMTKGKKVRDKIDSIIEEMINIDSEMIQELGGLPNGGLKGLLYYKIAIAKNNKVNIEVDVSNKVGKLFKKLDENKIRVLSKLIGVYCDNAIEAAAVTAKKIVAIEIYNLEDTINMVISNTFDPNVDISRRYEKGISTKGDKRGNGLYLASKLLRKSNWLSENQKIMDNLYIQRIIIKI